MTPKEEVIFLLWLIVSAFIIGAIVWAFFAFTGTPL